MADLDTPSLSDIIREKVRKLAEAEAIVLRLKKELADAKHELIGTQPAASRKSGNSTEMAEAVLREAGEPLHVNQILYAIERDYHVSVRYATLVGNLSRLVKKGRIFERVGPNRFGLRAWEVDREADQLFGRIESDERRGGGP